MSYQTAPSSRWADRRPWVALVVAIVVALLMLPGQAQASAVAKPKRVDFVTHGQSGFVEASDRSCPEPPAGVTQVALRGGTDFGRDPEYPDDTFVGSDAWEACFYQREDESVFAFGELELNGTFTGCGTGTLRFRYVATITPPDPETELREGTDTAWVIPDSGTGDLADVRRGRFTGETTIAPDQSVTGAVNGRLYC